MLQNADNPQEAVFTAATVGQGKLIVRSQGHEGYADLTVQSGELEALTVEPGSLTIAAGSSHDFSVLGKDGYGNEIKDSMEIRWEVISDVPIGSVTEDGVFSAEWGCGF